MVEYLKWMQECVMCELGRVETSPTHYSLMPDQLATYETHLSQNRSKQWCLAATITANNHSQFTYKYVCGAIPCDSWIIIICYCDMRNDLMTTNIYSYLFSIAAHAHEIISDQNVCDASGLQLRRMQNYYSWFHGIDQIRICMHAFRPSTIPTQSVHNDIPIFT